MNAAVFVMIAIAGAGLATHAHGEADLSISMDRPTFEYCDRLSYTIHVSEITQEFATIYIRDSAGIESSPVQISLTGLDTPVLSPYGFEKGIYRPGKYFVDVHYAGAQATAEFALADAGKICIPRATKVFTVQWLTGTISDGFLLGAIQRDVDGRIIDIPFEIGADNISDIHIPQWFKVVGYWWVHDVISDDEFANALNYLLSNGVIGAGSGR